MRSNCISRNCNNFHRQNEMVQANRARALDALRTVHSFFLTEKHSIACIDFLFKVCSLRTALGFEFLIVTRRRSSGGMQITVGPLFVAHISLYLRAKQCFSSALVLRGQLICCVCCIFPAVKTCFVLRDHHHSFGIVRSVPRYVRRSYAILHALRFYF